MALEQQMAQPAPAQEAPEDSKKLTKEEETDLKIVVLLAERMIDEGGYDVIKKALSDSNDPGQVVGQFLMQLGAQLHEKLSDSMEISKRVFFAHGGWVEQISDFLQEEYKVPKKVMDRAEMYIATAAQKMSQGATQQAVGGQPAPEQQQAAPMPQQPQGGV